MYVQAEYYSTEANFTRGANNDWECIVYMGLMVVAVKYVVPTVNTGKPCLQTKYTSHVHNKNSSKLVYKTTVRTQAMYFLE